MPTVKIRIGNRVIAELEPSSNADELRAALRQLCTHKNPAHATWQAFRARTKQGRFQEPPKTIETFKELPGGMISVPIGRLEELRQLAVNNGFQIAILKDDRSTDASTTFEVKWQGPPLWEHQRRLVNKSMSRWRPLALWVGDVDGGVHLWRSPAGSGKTLAALALIAELKVTTLVVAPTVPIMQQWIRDCRDFLGIEPGVLGGSKRTFGNVTIATRESAVLMSQKDPKFNTRFGLFIADEIQGHASDTCQVLADNIKSRYRLGVSQDERRADGMQFLIYDQFGTVVEEVDEPELISKGVVVPVDVVIVPTTFRAHWYTALAPDQKFRARSTLLEQMAASVPRNEQIASLIRNIASPEPTMDPQVPVGGEKVLVIVQRVDHARTIANRCAMHRTDEQYVQSILLLGKKEGFTQAQFQWNVEQFAKDPLIGVAIGTEKSVGVGFESHRRLARVLLAAPFVAGKSSEMQFRQFIKRASRSAEGKTRGIAYYMYDVELFGEKALKLIAKWVPRTMVLVNGRLISPSEYMDRRDRGAA